MKICAPSKIDNRIVMIGNIGLPSFLMDAPKPVMFDAGMSIMGPVYADAVEKILGIRQLDLLCITHSHYDHLGASSYLKHRFEMLRIAGHPLVNNVMKNPRAVATMKGLSDAIRQFIGDLDQSTEFVPPEIDIVLKEGDILDLGEGLSVTVLETPGHTRDSLTYFIESIGAVVPGEALGVVEFDGGIYPEFLTDFNSYVASARKIMAKKPSVILMPHGPSLTQDDAREFLQGVIPAAFAWRDMISEALHQSGQDVENATERLFERLYDPSRIGQEKNAFLMNLRAKVSCIVKLEHTSHVVGPS
jgi:glyoxylase-like metal-dependent hydrolase (beta-lactamase superfamily II)